MTRRCTMAAGLSLTLWLSIPTANAKDLSPEDFGNCGTDVVTTAGVETFRIPETWHVAASCLRRMRDLWNEDGGDATIAMGGAPALSDLVRHQVIAAMRDPKVVFVLEDGRRVGFDEAFPDARAGSVPVRMAMQTNKLGEPYNGMGQTGLAYYLYQLAARAEDDGKTADSDLYRGIARASVATVMTAADEGGLASMRPCADRDGLECTWFHSVTSDNRPAEAGGTLNQMLHVLRDLGMIADFIDRRDWSDEPDPQPAIVAGLNQLFVSTGHQAPGDPPNLADFQSAPASDEDPVWAWYGFDPTRPGGEGGYFLRDARRNCHYHVHSLTLLTGILGRATTEGGSDAALRAARDGQVIARFRSAAAQALTDAPLPEGISCTAEEKAGVEKMLSHSDPSE